MRSLTQSTCLLFFCAALVVSCGGSSGGGQSATATDSFANSDGANNTDSSDGLAFNTPTVLNDSVNESANESALSSEVGTTIPEPADLETSGLSDDGQVPLNVQPNEESAANTQQDPVEESSLTPEPEPFVDVTPFLPATDPVIPGGVGFGAFSIAGKFGLPCMVTNLNDHGPGSLRDCVDTGTSTEVTFDVAGLIRLETPLTISSPYISILGQSAPEPGITLTLDRFIDGPVVLVETHDVLMQHLRIRADAALINTCCRDGIFIGNPIPGNVYNVTMDHLSVSWATDELVDIWHDSRDITLSNSILSEALHRSTHEQGPAGRGLLMGADAKNVSMYRNLFAHNFQRNPALNGGGTVDLVNNIIYHWVSRGTEVSTRDQDNRTNIISNLYIAHPADQLQPSQTDWYDVELNGRGAGDLKVYFEGNIGFWRQDQNQPQWSLAGIDWRTPYTPEVGWHSDERFGSPFVVQPLDAENLETALFDQLGATLPTRDTTDRRILDEMQWRSGFMPDCVTDCELSVPGGWPSQ